MANTFSTDIDVLGLHRIVVHGTVDDPSNVAKVEIFRGSTVVGSAHVSANGTWRLTVAPSTPGVFDQFNAVVTDDTGNRDLVNSNFSLTPNLPFAVGDLAQIIQNDDPNLSEINFFASDGTFFISSSQQIQDKKTGFSETGHGSSVPFFCFTADQLGVTGALPIDITNFHVAKASHDFLDLSNGPFSTIAQVLRHTSTFQGSATIHLDQNSTVKVDGVTKAQLAQHHDVFFFG